MCPWGTRCQAKQKNTHKNLGSGRKTKTHRHSGQVSGSSCSMGIFSMRTIIAVCLQQAPWAATCLPLQASSPLDLASRSFGFLDFHVLELPKDITIEQCARIKGNHMSIVVWRVWAVSAHLSDPILKVTPDLGFWQNSKSIPCAITVQQLCSTGQEHGVLQCPQTQKTSEN